MEGGDSSPSSEVFSPGDRETEALEYGMHEPGIDFVTGPPSIPIRTRGLADDEGDLG